MGIGAVFVLLIVILVLVVLGGGFYALTMWLRGRQLHPDENKLEQAPEQPPRPEHVEVENEQHVRSVGTR